MSPAHTNSRGTVTPTGTVSLPSHSLGAQGSGVPRWHCASASASGAALLLCVAVLACVLAGNTESALIMSNCWAPGQDGAQLCVYSYKRTMYVVWYGRT